MDRNKQQNDIMFNLDVSFGIHGMSNAQSFFSKLTKLVGEYGDGIRIVGYSVRKPTARVDLTKLYDNSYIEVQADVSKAEEKDSSIEQTDSPDEETDASEEGEDNDANSSSTN